MLASRTRWQYNNFSEEKAHGLQEKLGISLLVAKLLSARGWERADEARAMLNITEQEFLDPFMLDGMVEAVQRIRQAIDQKEKIRVYGDYDCDGVSSTSLMVLALREAGANVDYYIPNRFQEGYGLNAPALEKAKEDKIGLVITVDTGIAGREEVAYGQSLGLDMIVTDHHEPPEALPECTAVINPKKPGCSYPFKHLAGVGVSLKVAQALLGRLPAEWLDIAAMGTIADLVPLIGENRLIAYQGLKALNRTDHVGLRALLAVAGLGEEHIDEDHVGFALGPRLNAAGRLASADPAVRLFLTQDPDEAHGLAQELNGLNQERQALVQQMSAEAIHWVEERYQGVQPQALVVAQEGWHEGVLGIVASRLVERYYVPTIVLSIDPQTRKATGSARSIEGFDMYKALSECKEWLSHFGGHPMAAGMSLAREHIGHVRSRLAQIAEQWLTEEELKPLTRVDFKCSAEDLSIEAVEDLQALAPYGVGNPKPIIAFERLSLKELKQVGTDDQHLKCKLQEKEVVLDGIGFGLGAQVPQISTRAKIDVLGEPSINEWNGTRKPQVLIKDIQVQEQQFFDWRGTRILPSKWREVYFEHSSLLFFFRHPRPAAKATSAGIAEKQAGMEELAGTGEELAGTGEELGDSVHPVYVDSSGTWSMPQEHLRRADTVILYDLPKSMEQLEQACQTMGNASRFYLLFQQEEQHFFSTFPTREHFRWYYGLLYKRGHFHLQNDGPKLAKHKGWTLDAIQFMTEVFLELEFVTMENDKVYSLEKPDKKPLHSSVVYQRKQEAYQLEQALIYSTYDDLVRLLQRCLNPQERLEEAHRHGL